VTAAEALRDGLHPALRIAVRRTGSAGDGRRTSARRGDGET
jgi:hypothetical protein